MIDRLITAELITAGIALDVYPEPGDDAERYAQRIARAARRKNGSRVLPTAARLTVSAILIGLGLGSL